MDVSVRPVTAFVKQSAKGVFHGSGCGGEDVGFDSGKMNDVFSNEAFGDVETLGIDFI